MKKSIYEEISSKRKIILSEEQLSTIKDILIKNDNLPMNKIDEEIKFFFTKLVFPNYYFRVNNLKEIAKIIETISAYKILGGNIVIEEKTKSGFVYIVPVENREILGVEAKIDYVIEKSLKNNEYIEIDMHKTEGKLLDSFLNVYIVERCSSPFYDKVRINELSGKIKNFIHNRYKINVSTENIKEFLKSKSKRYVEKSEIDRMSRYFLGYNRLQDNFLPDVSVSLTSDKSEYRFMITFNEFYYKRSFSALTSLFFNLKLNITRSYFSISNDRGNKILTFSYYISASTSRKILDKLKEDIKIALVSPDTKINKYLRDENFSLSEIFFLNSFSEFAHQFLRTRDSVLDAIEKLIKNNEELKYSFSEFQMKIEHEMFAMRTIQEILWNYKGYSKLLYLFFDEKFNPDKTKRNIKSKKEKLQKLLETERNEIVINIFRTGILFIDNILKTNFYKKNKAALIYKLRPEYLDKDRIELLPYSIFFIYGKDFKGYHVRFQDIARGGVRIVKSRNKEEYLRNSDYNFLEVYNLAFTQEKKNKDIPEGGSKGIILPYYKVKNFRILFYSYVDAMLDIMLSSKEITREYDKEEDIIFLGPDEGSADLMDWAALYAKQRGYKYWRAFTTGKSDEIGGISHIQYGMTTTGVHEYVLELLSALKVEEKDITKVQTGGPDGDLGSNEILISKDRTVAVIDGSGVAYDPSGLSRSELKRLAVRHSPIVNFNKEKLSKDGFVVSVNDKNLKLAKFKSISDGMELRNKFHFLVKSDLLLLAGGRPATIDIGNWKNIFLEDGELRYKYIVEGANLFITQAARLKLEEAGVILIKDSSANKGGVTSSSLEVLSSLVLKNDEFEKLMCRKNKVIPEFRKQYIDEILTIIKRNVRKEFNILWEENRRTSEAISRLSDKLSELIIRLANVLKKSDIIRKRNIIEKFMKDFIPEVLLKKYDINEIIKRVPKNYLDAIMAKEIASFFVYNTGINWINNVNKERKIDDENILRAYLKAYFEIEKIIVDNNINNYRLNNLLRISIKERTLQLLDE